MSRHPVRVEVISRRQCSACQDLKRRLAEAGIEFADWDTATVEGRAAAAWYDNPDVLPQVAFDGRLLADPEEVFRLAKGNPHARR